MIRRPYGREEQERTAQGNRGSEKPRRRGRRYHPVQNLIENAVKFHRQGERPQVRIYSRFLNRDGARAGAYEIYVQDSGIGFENKYAGRIFLPFERLVRRGEYQGVGMGLAICKKIVERHGGSISAKSTPGQGTTVTVTLPVKPKEASDSHRR